MSVDKFGRYSSSNNSPTAQGLRGPKGEGFTLTSSGDYDIQFKRICNVGLPTENGDAVNLDTFKATLGKFLSQNENNNYDVKGNKICNLSEPINDGDAVNKQFFIFNTPVKLADSYSFHQFRVQDVAYPKSDGDAVNYKTFKNNALVIDKGVFNAKNLIISNINDPKAGQDTVNLRYLQANSLFLKEKKEYDANGHSIKNLAFPKRKGDAINYTFLGDVLADMSFAIYNNLKKKKTKITKEEWKKKVTKSLYSCDWGDLFGISENALVQPQGEVLTSPVINTGQASGTSH